MYPPQSTPPPWLQRTADLDQPWAPPDLAQSPLTEVDPESISQLWEQLSAGQNIENLITTAVRTLRSEREKWLTKQEESKARAARRRVAKEDKKQLPDAFHQRAAKLLGLAPRQGNTEPPSIDEYE